MPKPPQPEAIVLPVHEASGPGPAAKRKYTSVSIRSSRPFAVESVVVRSYDPR